jgi:catechol 2,3-dioxygenase-like lactoylglutathione lyase family enzyme
VTKAHSAVVSVRYMIDDVEAAVAFYTNYLGFTLELNVAPAFAALSRGNLRLLLNGEKGLAGERCPMEHNLCPAAGIEF